MEAKSEFDEMFKHVSVITQLVKIVEIQSLN